MNNLKFASLAVQSDSSVLQSTTKLRYSRVEAAQLLGLSLRTLDRRVAEKEIRASRDGSRVLFTLDAIVQYSKRDHGQGVA